MTDWSPARQQAVQARCDKATKGPWHSPGFNEVHTDHDRGVFVGKDDFGDDDCVVADYCTDDNADFIAHARRDLPDALEVIARQQADLTRLAEVEEKARRVFEFGCSCGAVFDSLEAHANHVALVHTGPDAKEAARE